jgi:2-polyprenyl-3-methyl-5-hydroxy-6-metoxy-1,4-benzoquinol methylase
MTCCQCQGIESLFNQKMALQELEDYRKKGPDKTTRILLGVLKTAGVEGKTLLDIGGGVGAIQHQLIEAGIARAINVDASTGYIHVARMEANQLGYANRISYHHGDFVDLAPEIEATDIVTLNRVLCCYPDMEALVSLSAARAEKLYGLVYPRDTWWLKLLRPLANAFFWLSRNPFRLFLHPTTAVDATVRRQGLKPRFQRRLLVWQVVVYERGV